MMRGKKSGGKREKGGEREICKGGCSCRVSISHTCTHGQ